MNATPIIFDDAQKARQRQRFAKNYGVYNALFHHAAQQIAEHFTGEINQPFDKVLEIGCRDGALSTALRNHAAVGQITQTEWSPHFAAMAKDGDILNKTAPHALPFAPESFDLIVSNLNLHWVNDLPGQLIHIRQLLKPGGLFLATMLGENTLHELRHIVTQIESEHHAGISPRISPFTLVKDAGRLLQHAGFSLPVASSHPVQIRYRDLLQLMDDLRGMGESNALVQRRKSFTGRHFWHKAQQAYQTIYGDAEGCIHATYDIITLTGWAED